RLAKHFEIFQKRSRLASGAGFDANFGQRWPEAGEEEENGVKSASHQTPPVCSEETRPAECGTRDERRPSVLVDPQRREREDKATLTPVCGRSKGVAWQASSSRAGRQSSDRRASAAAYRFADARDDAKVRVPLAKDLNQPEPLAIKLHVLRKRAFFREISRIQLPPVFARPVSLAPVVGEGLVGVFEPPPRHLDSLDNGARPSPAVVHDPSLADLDAFVALARGPAGGRLRSGEHEFETFIRGSRAVAEREAFY